MFKRKQRTQPKAIQRQINVCEREHISTFSLLAESPRSARVGAVPLLLYVTVMSPFPVCKGRIFPPASFFPPPLETM